MLPLPLTLALHLGSFFAVAWSVTASWPGGAVHRAPNRVLFFLSIGGVLGGVFNALLAPSESFRRLGISSGAGCGVPCEPRRGRVERGHDAGYPIAVRTLVGFVLLPMPLVPHRQPRRRLTSSGGGILLPAAGNRAAELFCATVALCHRVAALLFAPYAIATGARKRLRHIAASSALIA